MNDVISLLALPTESLIALAGGYIGYRLTANGKDASHTNIDVVFGTLVFALISHLTSIATQANGVPLYLGALLAVLAAAATALLWRKWGEGALFWFCRRIKVSISTRHHTAWDPLRVKANLHPVQIIVKRKDGMQLMCSRLSDFAGKETGACWFGADGSVALYVTDVLEPGEDKDWVAQDIEGPDDWGALMTYIPASEVKQLMVRY